MAEMESTPRKQATPVMVEHLNIQQELDQLKREKEWVESILKSVADPIVLTNLNNEILMQNRRAADLLNLTDDDSPEKRAAVEKNNRLFNLYISGRADNKETVS